MQYAYNGLVTGIGGLVVESAGFVSGNGFDGDMVAGAFADGYNGDGKQFARTGVEDALAVIPITKVVQIGGRLVRGAWQAFRGTGQAAKTGGAGTEVVQRWMSQAELQATQSSGLLRGGRDGVHYVTDAANTAAQRARLRLALPQTPQVRVTLEVPGGAFSAPSRVQPNFNMPGGGMERTATGQIPVKILGVD